MVIDDIRVYNNTGLSWSLGDTPLVSFGSFGQYCKIEIDCIAGSAITGNLTFDAEMFGRLAFDNPIYVDGAHPNYGNPARGFVLDVTGVAVSTPTDMIPYGNNLTHSLGSVSLEITNAPKTEFTITHEFSLLKDVNDWMHSTSPTTLDNSDAMSSYGDESSVYETIKYYNIYVWCNGEYRESGAALAFSRLNEYNNSSPIVSDIEFEYYDVGATQRDFLCSNEDTTVRVKFDDFDSIAFRVDLVVGSEDITTELERESQLELQRFTTTTLTVISGTEKYAEFTISNADLDYSKKYYLLATIQNAAAKSSSKSDLKKIEFAYDECVPAIDTNWLSYLNTDATTKIDCAPYERMGLEITIWHDQDPLLSPSYETCLLDQEVFNNTLLTSFKTLTIPLFNGETHVFTNDDGTITSNYTEDEIESGDVAGNDFTKFKIFFRVEEPYVAQLHTFDASLYSELVQVVAVGGTLTEVVVVEHTIDLPLEVRCAVYQNDEVSPEVTALDIYDTAGNLRTGAICEDDTYFECIAESTDLLFEVQAYMVKPNGDEEEELFNSAQTEAYFDTRTTNRIYDLEGDFTSGNNCSFKITNEAIYDKIMVICCK